MCAAANGGSATGRLERFLLPNGPREAAALATLGAVRQRRPSRPASAPLAVFAIVVGVYAGVIASMASGRAAALWAIAFVPMSWAAVRALWRAVSVSGTGARARGRSIALSREDSKRIARRAASAFVDVLRAGDRDVDAAFDDYHEVLVSLARFELVAGQAVAADRDLTRLLRDDPLRSVAGQMAQDKAAQAVTHRAAARAAADELQAVLLTRRENPAARPPGAP